MAGCEAHTFDIGLSLAIVQKGFEKSFNDGLVAAKSETQNLITALKEKLTPKTARFDNVVTYELKEGVAYWKNDPKPVAYHLTKNSKLLSMRGAPEEFVEQAKRDEEVWEAVQPRLSQLKPGQAIQYLSQKDPDPSHGVALQQVVNDNGVIKHQSHLLPFNTRDQINKFLNLAGQGRDDLSLDSDVSGWIVAGDRIDFDQDLPELMLESMMSKPKVINWQETVTPVWPQLNQIQPVSMEQLMPFLHEDRVTDIEPSSFWWQVMVEPTPILFEPRVVFENQPEIQTETPLPVLNTVDSFWFEVAAAAAVVAPTRLDLEGLEGASQTVDLGVGKPVTIFEASHTEVVQESVRLKQEPTKQQLNDTVVNDRRCFPEIVPIRHIPFRNGIKPKILEKPEITASVIRTRTTPTILFESVAAAAVVAPTRLDLEGLEGANDIQAVREEEGKLESDKQVVFSVDNHKTAALKISRVSTELRHNTKEVPIYQPRWQAAAIKDIPEWVWQGMAAIPDEIIDWSWFLVTMFYALLNTKVLLNGKIS